MPRAKKPPPKRRFTPHQITLDPETLSIVQAIIGTAPEVDSLSAAIRHAIRSYQPQKPRTGKSQ